jgi:hypothetical protein
MIAPTRTRSIAGPEHPVNPQVLTEKFFGGEGFNPLPSIILEHMFYISKVSIGLCEIKEDLDSNGLPFKDHLSLDPLTPHNRPMLIADLRIVKV